MPIAADGFNVSRLDLGSHSGTHCDAPFHFREGRSRIDGLPLERFVGRGVVIDATDLGPRTAIGWERIEPHAAALGPGIVVLLRTGWDVHRESEEYFAHPFLDGDACARILDLARFRCHAQISDADGVIVENLVGLGAIEFPDPLVSVLPLRIAGGDGAPARAVAIEGLA